jgi:dTMP kinase
VANGLFITFEGVEGSGKTTQIEMLRKWLDTRGLSVLVTREPGGDPAAEAIREIVLQNPVAARTELLLFLASRAQNVENVIRPALAAGKVVICDRFIDSSVAYQGYARGLGRDTVASLNHFATDALLPDVTFLLDLNPEVGLGRQADRNRMEAESLSFHQAVRKGFLAEAENCSERICVLDASGSFADIHFSIANYVRKILEERSSDAPA